jgi:hypothetical protein
MFSLAAEKDTPQIGLLSSTSVKVMGGWMDEGMSG